MQGLALYYTSFHTHTNMLVPAKYFTNTAEHLHKSDCDL